MVDLSGDGGLEGEDVLKKVSSCPLLFKNKKEK